MVNPQVSLPPELPPAQETKRIDTVRGYGILDTPADGAFDRIAAIAARLFDVPIAIVSIVDTDRIWFKAHHGLDVQEIGRDPGLCASCILQDDAWILSDAKRDVRSLANPLVAGEFGLRFYAGVPLKTKDGYDLGTLCVIDRVPRTITPEQVAHLKDLAAVVMDQLELQLRARDAIGEMSQLIAEKEKALVQSGMMAKEIDHRVMNSLQLASSLLVMHSRQTSDRRSATQLAEAANRISAIARVHQHIFMNENVGLANCKEYLERICEDLQALYQRPENLERIKVDAVDAQIPTRQIVPIGLIVNELTTNAAKHGAREIVVSLQRGSPGGFLLSVTDDGVGLPGKFDPAATSGLGMKIVSALAQQLGGDVQFTKGEGGKGTRFTITIAPLAN